MAIEVDEGFTAEVAAKIEPLSEKITQLRALHGVGYALKGEFSSSWSSARLADAIRILHGDEVVAELAAMPRERLRKELRKYLVEMSE